MIILPFVTRILSEEEYGQYALATSIFGVVVVVAQLGLPNAYVVYFYKINDKKNELLSNITGIYIYALFGVWILSFISIASGFSKKFDIPLILILWVLLASTFEIFFELIRVNLRLEKKALAYALFMIIRFILFNASFVLLLIFDFGAGELKFICMTVFTLGAIIFYVTTNKTYFPNLRKTEIKKKLFKFIFPIYPGLLLKVFLISIDHFIVLFFLDFKALAVYALAVQLTWPINRFSASVLDAFAPNIYEKLSSNDSKKPEYFFKQLTYFLIILNIICFPLIIMSEFYVDLLVSSNNQSEILSVFMIVLLGRFFESLSPYFEIYYYHHHKTLTIGILSISFFMILVLSQFLFIPLFGLSGAVYAYAFSRVVYFLLLVIFMNNKFLRVVSNNLVLLCVPFLFAGVSIYITTIPMKVISLLLMILALAYLFKKEIRSIVKKPMRN